jgi:hypothetical protein
VYEWAEPIRIAAGSTIKAIGHYDNSASNRLNPSPDSEVYWSEQSWDEMFNGYVDLSIDKMDVRLETKRRADRTDLATAQVPIVTVVGCVSRGADGVAMLTKASHAQISLIVHADAGEIAAARNTPLGTNQYRLVGAAEFGSERELLSQGQRTQFTHEATANVTHSLTDRHRVFVKALAIPGAEARLNVLSAQTIAGDCR